MPPLSANVVKFLVQRRIAFTPPLYDLMGWKIIMMKSQLAQPSRVTEPRSYPPAPLRLSSTFQRGCSPIGRLPFLRNFSRRMLSCFSSSEARVQRNYGVSNGVVTLPRWKLLKLPDCFPSYLLAYLLTHERIARFSLSAILIVHTICM